TSTRAAGAAVVAATASGSPTTSIVGSGSRLGPAAEARTPGRTVRRLNVRSPRITGYAIAPSTVSVPSVAASYAGRAIARKSWNVRWSAKGVVRVTTSASDPLRRTGARP